MIIELNDSKHQHKLECKYCKHVIVAGASRTKVRFLHIKLTCGVAKCTADEAVRQPVLDEMRAIDAQNKSSSSSSSSSSSAALARQKYSSR